ncbi:hypothetical protein M2322_003700 [Rhodoblastus acidophilus]|uniref:hypothetical protein n=1 Tax=Rhodoblastus acidophilus TaxID=1074 RepID=UPI0022257957|nr:hypothetical protein [Rhodoblastus acidophilus]MCW2318133.1 hypothetical protein [Rhodoblastus acidophilus]
MTLLSLRRLWALARTPCWRRRDRTLAAVILAALLLVYSGRLHAQGAAEADAAAAARACIAAKQKGGDLCNDVGACLADYRKRFPNGASRADLDSTAGRLTLGCAFARDEQSFDVAKSCAAAASSACAAQSCLAQYRRDFPTGLHSSEALQLETARLQDCVRESERANPRAAPSATPLADGDYLGDASPAPACGVVRQRIDISACGGRIQWRHKAPLAASLPPAPVQWEGEIDASGDVRASVRGNASFVAHGHVGATERRIEMRYPDCASAIGVAITGQLASGCSQKPP